MISSRKQRTTTDPFTNLAPELLYLIFKHLPTDALLHLIAASPTVHFATDRSVFWKQLIYEDLAFFPEERELITSLNEAEIDFKRLYLWLEARTTPMFGMRGPFMGMANRRRIWNACLELKPHYSKQLSGKPLEKPEDVIVQQSECSHMPFLCLPRANEPLQTLKKFWLHSLTELDHHAATFEAFWNSSGALVGIGMAFGPSRRIFGTDESNGSTLRKSVVRMIDGQSIACLRFHIAPAQGNTESAAHVVGIEVVEAIFKPCCFQLTSNQVQLDPIGSQILGSCSIHDGSLRRYVVANGNALVGVTGQISEVNLAPHQR